MVWGEGKERSVSWPKVGGFVIIGIHWLPEVSSEVSKDMGK